MTWNARRVISFNEPDVLGLAFRSPEVGIGLFNYQEPARLYFLSTSDSGKNWIKSDAGITPTSGGTSSPSITYLSNGEWICSIYYEANHNSIFYKSTDDGVSWHKTSTVDGGVFFTKFSGKFGYATAEGYDSSSASGYSVIYSSSDYGENWIKDTLPTPKVDFYFAVSTPNGKTAYAISYSSSIIKTTTGGVSEVIPIIDFEKEFITVFPNPTIDYLTVNFNAGSSEITLIITDVLGREAGREMIPPNSTSYSLDIRRYPAGAYYVRIGSKTTRFVKM